MKQLRIVAVLMTLVLLRASAGAQNGWTPLFNGRDLTGWHPCNGTVEDPRGAAKTTLRTRNAGVDGGATEDEGAVDFGRLGRILAVFPETTC